MGLDQADGLENLGGGAGFDLFLLAVQQGEHFAVVLQFLAQRGDERFDTVSGTCSWITCLFSCRWGAASGVSAGGAAEALGKTWWASSPCKLLASPNEPERLMLSASWLLIMSS